jgi:hypothetical protein
MVIVSPFADFLSARGSDDGSNIEKVQGVGCTNTDFSLGEFHNGDVIVSGGLFDVV